LQAFIEPIARVQGLDRAALDDALAALQQRADDVQALLRRIIADMQDVIAAGGPAGARLTFARPARFQATIVSPTAHRFLALLTQADETLARLEMAWLLGLVDPATRTALAGDCRRALHGFKDLAADRRQAVGELVRQVNAQRREGLSPV
jgi:ABC-type transporter Mla subunit MlaD